MTDSVSGGGLTRFALVADRLLLARLESVLPALAVAG